MKRAFTLIELIIVIGIIGILMASLLLATRGSAESARAAKCMANIRSLATAANARAMDCGWYPLAGSRETVTIETGRTGYDEQIGWISWLSNKGDPYGSFTPGKAKPSAHQSVEICTYTGEGASEEDITYAITNGCIWRYTGQNMDTYVCPEHARSCLQRGTVKPRWSYVMNMKFGFDYSEGSKATSTSGLPGDIAYGRLQKADRILMFAELPIRRITTDGTEEDVDLGKAESDCTLQYNITVDGQKYGGLWSGKSEEIGFNHTNGKRGHFGHVAFADGHAEKIMYGSGLDPKELTALLCNGVDVAFDGKEWKKITGQDDNDD